MDFPKPIEWNTLPLYKKVQIYGRHLNHLYAPYVDKLDAKPKALELSHNKIKVAKLIRELKSSFDISQEDINPNHLLKATHGSGWVLDFAEIKDLTAIKLTLNSWNCIFSKKLNQYKFIKPRFYIEEKIPCIYTGKSGKAQDIKVHCIWGQPYFLLFRKDQKLRNYFDIEWNPVMPLEFTCEKPENFDEILDMCKMLSKPFEYVRIDLYMGTDGIYFGEFTFTPNAGKQRLSDIVEYKYGALW
jgi:hypothetical protein